jgi:hypothetical protein
MKARPGRAEETFAETLGNGREAPIVAIHVLQIRAPDAPQSHLQYFRSTDLNMKVAVPVRLSP